LLSGALHKYGDMGPASLARDPVRKIPPRIPRKKFAVLRQKSFANWQGFSSASTAKKVTTDEHTDPCSSVFICEAATEYLRRYELSRLPVRPGCQLATWHKVPGLHQPRTSSPRLWPFHCGVMVMLGSRPDHAPGSAALEPCHLYPSYGGCA